MIKVTWHRMTRDNVGRAFSASILFAADGGTNITVSRELIRNPTLVTRKSSRILRPWC